jgi:PIN domain nuclease of toxin-antitoxin system
MILLDTHITVWLATDHSRLRAGELAVILEPDNEIAVSTVSVWEVRIKWLKQFRSGERKGPIDPHDLLLAIRQMNIAVLPLSPEHAAAELQIPLSHRDPFDELLLSIAQELGGRLLTRDAELRGHPLAIHAA